MIRPGDRVECLTNEYLNIKKGKQLIVTAVKKNSNGNINIKLRVYSLRSKTYYSNWYWIGKFRKVENRMCVNKKYIVTSNIVTRGASAVDYSSDDMDDINAFVAREQAKQPSISYNLYEKVSVSKPKIPEVDWQRV